MKSFFVTKGGCILGIIAALCALTVSAGATELPDPFLSIPGRQIGLVKLPATEADFIEAYGKEAQPGEIGEQEGAIERATVLFPCD